jgi:hypothetical protein
MMVRLLAVTPGGVGSDDGQALAALAATSIDDGTAPTGGHASAEANLTGALLAVWSESRLHRCKSLKGPTEVPEHLPHVKGEL